MKTSLPAGVLVCAGLFALPGPEPAEAECRATEPVACALTLHGEGAPAASADCRAEAWSRHLSFQQPEGFSDSDGDGWDETVLEIDLDPDKGCGCAVFRVFYDGEPHGYTVNVGDSPTNDGAGGDNYSTIFAAEIEVQRNLLRVFSASWPPTETGRVDRLLDLQSVPLADSILELEVCDQMLSFRLSDSVTREERLAGSIHARRAQNLFAIHDRPGDNPKADHKIYAAFNRVIRNRTGKPHRNRRGHGVRRVELYLSP